MYIDQFVRFVIRITELHSQHALRIYYDSFKVEGFLEYYWMSRKEWVKYRLLN